MSNLKISDVLAFLESNWLSHSFNQVNRNTKLSICPCILNGKSNLVRFRTIKSRWNCVDKMNPLTHVRSHLPFQMFRYIFEIHRYFPWFIVISFLVIIAFRNLLNIFWLECCLIPLFTCDFHHHRNHHHHHQCSDHHHHHHPWIVSSPNSPLYW